MKDQFEFPRRFLWGAGGSAHQTEGGMHNQWSVWELEHAKTLAVQAPHKDAHLPVWHKVKRQAESPTNYISGRATQQYTRYEEDFALLDAMHMNAYRCSIEWSRIEPEEGIWNAEAIEHYRRYLHALTRRGIEPIVTLFHFTLPVWFAERGGFEHRANIQYFVRFAEHVLRELGKDIRFVITINEPEVYVQQGYLDLHFPPQIYSKLKAWRVLRNLALAHNRAADAIHAINRRYKVSVAKQTQYFYAGDDAWLSNVSAWVMQYVWDDYFLKKVVRRCDFIGVNYHVSNRVYGYRVHNPEDALSDLGVAMTPADIEYALVRIYEKYKKPVLVTGNGIADSEDAHRKWWISQTILGMHRAMREGVPLLGYIYWSLTDNFEWSFGRWPRFGLAELHYASGERALRPSARWFGSLIKKLRR